MALATVALAAATFRLARAAVRESDLLREQTAELRKSEEPRLAVMSIDVGPQGRPFQPPRFGVAVVMGVANLARTGNAVRRVDLLLRSAGREVILSQPQLVNPQGNGVFRFYAGVGGWYWDAPFELTDFPVGVAPLSPVRIQIYRWGELEACFENAAQIVGRQSAPEFGNEYTLTARIQDIYGNWFEGPAE